jgi:transposase-like protein
MSKEADPSNQTKPSKQTAKARRKRTPSPHYSAQEKVQAVLAVWTEKARPAEISRQLSINWITLSQWQDRAMEGMLQALESRVNLANGEALSPRLQALLSRRQQQPASRLSNRLEKIQAARAEKDKPKS